MAFPNFIFDVSRMACGPCSMKFTGGARRTRRSAHKGKKATKASKKVKRTQRKRTRRS